MANLPDDCSGIVWANRRFGGAGWSTKTFDGYLRNRNFLLVRFSSWDHSQHGNDQWVAKVPPEFTAGPRAAWPVNRHAGQQSDEREAALSRFRTDFRG